MEKWLLKVQEMMIRSLKDVMQEAVDAYVEVPRSKWVVEWPGQVVLAVSSIYWTMDVTAAIQEGTVGVSGQTTTEGGSVWWGRLVVSIVPPPFVVCIGLPG